MSIINFTVNYDQLAGATDGDDVGVDADIVPLMGTVLFTPQFSDDSPVLAASYSPRPAGFKIMQFSGFLDTDGRLKTGPGGTVGVRLFANDPVFNLDSLVYKVSFVNIRTVHGEPVSVKGGYFAAPNEDVTINLAEELQTAESFGGPRISGGSFVGDTVIFENSDSSLVDAITIPDGVVVFTDNGDGTWSAG